MDDLEKLLAIDAVKRLKATYFYAVDTKNYELLATIYDEESIADFRGERDLKPGESVAKLAPVEEALAAGDNALAKGGDNIVALIREAITPLVTVHHGKAPIIDVIGPDEVKGIWPMFDYVDNGQDSLKGYGHYHETYRKIGERWILRHSVVTRLRTDGRNPVAFAQQS